LKNLEDEFSIGRADQQVVSSRRVVSHVLRADACRVLATMVSYPLVNRPDSQYSASHKLHYISLHDFTWYIYGNFPFKTIQLLEYPHFWKAPWGQALGQDICACDEDAQVITGESYVPW